MRAPCSNGGGSAAVPRFARQGQHKPSKYLAEQSLCLAKRGGSVLVAFPVGSAHPAVMKTQRAVLLLCTALLAAPTAAIAADVQILSLSGNGLLSWTNASLNVTCRVEWASSAAGPWHDSWESLSAVVVTNHVTERSVPMFYRVVCPQTITNVTPTAALALISDRQGDTNFTILDVRTQSEYAPRHMKGAINLDFRSVSPPFADQLKSQDKARTYLVYCASGSRSGQATEVMRGQGFLLVYNMTSGFASFASLPGATPFLEP